MLADWELGLFGSMIHETLLLLLFSGAALVVVATGCWPPHVWLSCGARQLLGGVSRSEQPTAGRARKCNKHQLTFSHERESERARGKWSKRARGAWQRSRRAGDDPLAWAAMVALGLRAPCDSCWLLAGTGRNWLLACGPREALCSSCFPSIASLSSSSLSLSLFLSVSLSGRLAPNRCLNRRCSTS